MDPVTMWYRAKHELGLAKKFVLMVVSRNRRAVRLHQMPAHRHIQQKPCQVRGNGSHLPGMVLNLQGSDGTVKRSMLDNGMSVDPGIREPALPPATAFQATRRSLDINQLSIVNRQLKI